jgi:signal transduction histidine kinase
VNDGIWKELTARFIEITAFGLAAIMLVAYIFKRESYLRLQAEIAKEQAIAAAKAKSDFLAYTAHELRSPLSFIIGGSEMIYRQILGPLPEKYVEYIKNIHKTALELKHFIDDLLDQIRLEDGKFSIKDEHIDINNLVAELNLVHAAKLADKSMELVTNIQPKIPQLIADLRRVKQILNNLITNAIKYSEQSTTIKLNIFSSNQGITIIVEDQGPGMTKQEINIALMKYGTVRGANKHADSIGLGLPLVKDLIEAHQAKFLISSKKGGGTKITIIFPPERVAANTDSHA